MYTIVAGIGTDVDSARRIAEEIANLPIEDIDVILAHSFEDNPEGASISQIASARRSREILEANGVNVRFEERSGDPATRVLTVADEYDADLLCVGSRKRSPAGKAVFGSVTQEILLNTDRPVLVCGT